MVGAPAWPQATAPPLETLGSFQRPSSGKMEGWRGQPPECCVEGLECASCLEGRGGRLYGLGVL